MPELTLVLGRDQRVDHAEKEMGLDCRTAIYMLDLKCKIGDTDLLIVQENE